MLAFRLARIRAPSALTPKFSLPVRSIIRNFSTPTETNNQDDQKPEAEPKEKKVNPEEILRQEMEKRKQMLAFDYSQLPPFDPLDFPAPPQAKSWFIRNQRRFGWVVVMLFGYYIFQQLSTPDGIMSLLSRRQPGFLFSIGMFLLQIQTASGQVSPLLLLHTNGDEFVNAIARHLHPNVEKLDFDRFDEWLKRRVRSVIPKDFFLKSLAEWAYSKSEEPRLADLLGDLRDSLVGDAYKKLSNDQKIGIQTAAMILYTLAEPPYLRDTLSKRVDVAMAMYDLAFCPDSQIAAAGLAYLKFMLQYDGVRKHFLADNGLDFLLDIVKQSQLHDPTIPSRGPEVMGQAIECLATLGAAMADTSVPLETFNIPSSPKDLENILNPLYNGALTMLEQKNYPTAEAISRGALRLDPTNPSFLAVLGHCAEGQHNYQEAGQMYDKARSYNPVTDVAFPYARLVFSGILNECKGLTKEEKAAKALDALYPAFLHSRSYGLMQQRQHQAKTGLVVSLDEIIPKYNESYNLLIDCLETLGRIDDAKKLANEWAVNSPNEAVAHFHLGRLLYQLGDNTTAERELLRAANINPLKPEIPYHLALVALAQDKPEDAKKYSFQSLECCQEQEKEVESKFQKRQRAREKKKQSFLTGQLQFLAQEEAQKYLDQLKNEEEADRKTTEATKKKLYRKMVGVNMILGKAYYANEDFPTSLSYYDKFLQEKRQALGDRVLEDPTYIPAELKRARVLSKMEQLPEVYNQLKDVVVQWKSQCQRAKSCKNYFHNNDEERNFYQQIAQTCTASLSTPELQSLCQEYSSLKQMK